MTWICSWAWPASATTRTGPDGGPRRPLQRLLDELLFRRPLPDGKDAQAGAATPDPTPQDSRPLPPAKTGSSSSSGDIRTYKIHLGSGNILMEPNDQYLCIVPTRAQTTGNLGNRLFLPFEGDRTLAIILSKALPIWQKTQEIKDPTILHQISS